MLILVQSGSHIITHFGHWSKSCCSDHNRPDQEIGGPSTRASGEICFIFVCSQHLLVSLQFNTILKQDQTQTPTQKQRTEQDQLLNINSLIQLENIYTKTRSSFSCLIVENKGKMYQHLEGSAHIQWYVECRMLSCWTLNQNYCQAIFRGSWSFTHLVEEQVLIIITTTITITLMIVTTITIIITNMTITIIAIIDTTIAIMIRVGLCVALDGATLCRLWQEIKAGLLHLSSTTGEHKW